MMDKKLNYQDNIKLIKLYRSYPILWDMNHKSYRRHDIKDKVYEEIGKEMGMTPDNVRKKLRCLRITYTGEKRKMMQKSGSGADENYVSSLKWFNEMSFLEGSIVVRKSFNSSAEDSCNSKLFEGFEEVECDDNLLDEKPIKRPRKDKLKRNLMPDNKLTNIADKDNEFSTFATSISYQLQKLPEEDAYKLMSEIQNLVTQRKLKHLRAERYSNESTYIA